MKPKLSFFLVVIILCSGFLSAQPIRDVDKMLKNPHKEDSLIMRFNPGTTQAQKELFFLKLNAVKVKAYKVVPDLYAITLPAKSDLKTTLTWLLDNREVMYAEPNGIAKLTRGAHPNDIRYDELWGMEKIKAPQAWHTRTDSTIVIASLDTGVDYKHPDLAANMWTNPGEIPNNGKDDDGNGYVDDFYGYDTADDEGDPMDEDLHGTHTSGTMAARGNNVEGVVGVCWRAKIVAIDIFFGLGAFLEDRLEALEYIILNQQVKVANMSYGSPDFEQSEYDMMAAARDHGIICVCAAGNEYTNNDITPTYPANYELDNVISVASTDKNDELYDDPDFGSNYGVNTVDLAAPGVHIYSTIVPIPPDPPYGFEDGTSMATPHVSGACALIWSEHPHLSYKQVISRIYRNVDVIPGLPVRTSGRLNLYNAMHDMASKKEDPNETGCSAYVDSGSFGLGNLLPYLAILFFAVWRWVKVHPAF